MTRSAPPVANTNPLERPRLTAPGPDDHKYTRGFVTVIGGAMPGAAALATLAAARAGAGYVQLVARERMDGLPFAIVQRCGLNAAELLTDERIDAVVIGMGLGRDEPARILVGHAVASGRRLVLDADALPHLEWPLASPAILTPHAGEFARNFPDLATANEDGVSFTGGRLQAVLTAARRTGATVILKGNRTLVASPDGRSAIASPASGWLATAGTGDVLAGLCGTMLAQLRVPFPAACAAVWLHSRSAHARTGPFVADDLVDDALTAAVAECLTD